MKTAVSQQAPIGIFDSGIGGLTVADAIRRILPGESIIYFGDTVHMPYGEKSPDAIRGYAERITDLFLDLGCKMIVIACNSASSVAFETVRDRAKGKAMVVDVINPVVSKVASQKNLETVGVIGTRATIRSNAYQSRLNEKNPLLKVCSQATPLLAPMIEEGFFNNKISRTIIHNYLSRPKLRKIEVLILACTHYPLIKKEISEYYGTKVKIIDSAEIVAKFVEAELKRKRLLSERKSSGSCRFFVSDLTTSFEKSTQIFFRGKIKLELKNLWKS